MHTSTWNTWMTWEYLVLSPAAPLSVKNVRVRNGVGQMVDSLQGKNPSYALQYPSGWSGLEQENCCCEIEREGEIECSNKIHKKDGLRKILSS